MPSAPPHRILVAGIIRWGFRTRDTVRKSMPAVIEANPHLAVVRLRNQAETDTWIAGLG